MLSPWSDLELTILARFVASELKTNTPHWQPIVLDCDIRANRQGERRRASRGSSIASRDGSFGTPDELREDPEHRRGY